MGRTEAIFNSKPISESEADAPCIVPEVNAPDTTTIKKSPKAPVRRGNKSAGGKKR